MRILVAEDGPLLGDERRAGLCQLGFQIGWVPDGKAAERELRAKSYAAVILDLGVPKKDGLDVRTSPRARALLLPTLRTRNS